MQAIVLALLLSQTGSFGGVMPAQGTAVGGKRTTDGRMVPFMIDGTGALVTAGGTGGGTVDQGNAGSAAQGWFVKITDGTDIASVSSSGVLLVDGSGVVQPISGTIAVSTVGGTVAISGSVTVTSAPTTAVTQSTSPWVVGDGSGALNTIIDSGTVTTVTTVGAVTTITNPVTVTDGAGALNVIVDSGSVSATVTGSVAASIAPTAVASASNTGTCTNVTSNTTVLASNASRRVAMIYNSPASTANVHVKLGATATTSNPPLVPGQSITIEAATVYTGVVDAIAASGTQTVCVYEW